QRGVRVLGSRGRIRRPFSSHQVTRSTTFENTSQQVGSPQRGCSFPRISSRSGAGPDPVASVEPCRTGEGQPPAGTTPALCGGLRLAPERHGEAADRPNRRPEPPDRDPLALLGELSRAPGAAAGGQHLGTLLRLPGAALL